MRYYIITGERSGDMHAGNLVRELKILDTEADIRGVGGDYLSNAGAEIAWHYNDIAIMGFLEVVTHYRKVMDKFSKVKADILAYKPDVLILVDFGGFNLRIAKFAKKHNLKVFYYITPKVWAWNQKRAYKIKKLVDRMFVILPFEKEFYKNYDWEVDYVGNPVFDAIKNHSPDPDFLSKNNLQNKKIVALLPGSRKQELLNVLPVYREVIDRFKDYHFVVAGIKSISEELYVEFKNLSNASVVYEQTYDLLSYSKAAIVTSGTATLETALFNVPQVVVYRTSGISYAIAKKLIRVKFISLVNLICGREVVKELIQKEMNPTAVGDEVGHLLNNDQRREEVLEGYQQIKEILGEKPASKTTAALVVNYLSKTAL